MREPHVSLVFSKLQPAYTAMGMRTKDNLLPINQPSPPTHLQRSCRHFEWRSEQSIKETDKKAQQAHLRAMYALKWLLLHQIFQIHFSTISSDIHPLLQACNYQSNAVLRVYNYLLSSRGSEEGTEQAHLPIVRLRLLRSQLVVMGPIVKALQEQHPGLSFGSFHGGARREVRQTL